MTHESRGADCVMFVARQSSKMAAVLALGLDQVDHGEAGYHLQDVGTLAHGHSEHSPLAAVTGPGQSVAGASDH
jgi:hypothetical protein